MGFLGLSWALNVPILVDILRLPGLNMMSHNRFVFVTSFAILAMAAVGLDLLWQRKVQWSPWTWAPVGVLAILFVWCVYRTFVLPEPLATQLPNDILNKGQVLANNPKPGAIFEVQSNFRRSYAIEVALCTIALAGWLLIRLRSGLPRAMGPFLGCAMVGELLWFGYGVNAQCEPSLYYPRIPALQEIAKAPPGRAIGYGCLPANLLRTHGLRDVRGYDAVDPLRMVEILGLAASNQSTVFAYSATQNLVPKILDGTPAGPLRLHPVMDLLGVRYVIFRGAPPQGFQPTFMGPDYWVLTNQFALPRAFVPKKVETVTDSQIRLLRMNDAGFKPQDVAFIEEAASLPGTCDGTARIDAEVPTRISIIAEMKTPGLVVLSDLWDKGWNAYLAGQKVPILRANHALRGVVAPAGTSTIEFRYEPASLTLGLWLAAAALVLVLAWSAFAYARSRTGEPAAAAA
jgi:hypothetical protein